jgi:hypothetical protein
VLDVTITNCNLDLGNGSGGVGANAIYASTIDQVVFTSNTISYDSSNTLHRVIYGVALSESVVTNNYVINAGELVNTSLGNNSVVSNNTLSSSYALVWFGSSINTIIANNKVDNTLTTTYMISVFAATRVIISNNILRAFSATAAAGDMILVSGISDVVIESNVLANSGSSLGFRYGINVGSVSGLVVNNNRVTAFQSTTGASIRLSSCSFYSVNSNVISTAANGIEINNGTNGNVSTNTVESNTGDTTLSLTNTTTDINISNNTFIGNNSSMLSPLVEFVGGNINRLNMIGNYLRSDHTGSSSQALLSYGSGTNFWITANRFLVTQGGANFTTRPVSGTITGNSLYMINNNLRGIETTLTGGLISLNGTNSEWGNLGQTYTLSIPPAWGNPCPNFETSSGDGWQVTNNFFSSNTGKAYWYTTTINEDVFFDIPEGAIPVNSTVTKLTVYLSSNGGGNAVDIDISRANSPSAAATLHTTSILSGSGTVLAVATREITLSGGGLVLGPNEWITLQLESLVSGGLNIIGMDLEYTL